MGIPLGSSAFTVFFGVMGSTSWIKLADRIFGFNHYQTLEASVYRDLLQVVGWWDFMSSFLTTKLETFSGMQTESGTIAEIACWLVISTVGVKYFVGEFKHALQAQTKGKPGPKHPDPNEQKKHDQDYRNSQKRDRLVSAASQLWLLLAMFVCYFIVVFATNLNSLNLNADMVKGMAFPVLALLAYKPLSKLIQSSDFLHQVGTMIVCAGALTLAARYVIV